MTEEIQNVEQHIDAEAETTAVNEEKTEILEAGESQDTKPSESTADNNVGEPDHKKRAKRRIGQLTRKVRIAEQKNQDLVDRLDALEKRVPIPEDPRPRRDDFETLEEYEDAIFDWKDSKRESKPETKQPTAQPSSNDIQDAFEAEIEAIDPDMVGEVMDGDWPCTQVMTDFVMTSENKAALAIHLATNPDTAEKISKMSPPLAARELTKVEGKLSSETKPGAHVNTAPPPIEIGKPSGGTGSTAPEKMSTEQWVAERRAGRI